MNRFKLSWLLLAPMLALAVSACDSREDTLEPGTHVALLAIDPHANPSPLRITTLMLPGYLSKPVTQGGSTFPTGGHYSAEIRASGGSGTGYAWTLSVGTLHTGWSLHTTGTPATTLVGPPTLGPWNGSAFFEVTVTDSVGRAAARQFQAPVIAEYYLDEPAIGQFAFMLDCGKEMGTVDAGQTQSRFTRARINLLNQLNQLGNTDFFDVGHFGGGLEVDLRFGNLVQATPGNLAAATAYVNGLSAGGPSPMYSALLATPYWGAELNKFFFYSGSKPGRDTHAPGGFATYAQILQMFPYTWSALTDCTLVSLNFAAADTNHTQFLQQLAASAGGTYAAP